MEYWYQHRQSIVVIKKIINKDVKKGGEYIFIYHKRKATNTEKLRNPYLKLPSPKENSHLKKMSKMWKKKELLL